MPIADRPTGKDAPRHLRCDECEATRGIRPVLTHDEARRLWGHRWLCRACAARMPAARPAASLKRKILR